MLPRSVIDGINNTLSPSEKGCLLTVLMVLFWICVAMAAVLIVKLLVWLALLVWVLISW